MNKILLGNNKCTGCTACYSACPVNAIEMVVNKEGFYQAIINEEKCVNCNMCVRRCPVNNNVSDKYEKPLIYAGWSLDKKNRSESSSGGFFTELAKSILKKDGVVVGVVFDEHWKVTHKEVEKEDDLYELKGAKYVQSDLGETFKKIKAHLKNDRYVLFVGTPCQVGGIAAYLKGTDITKLYLIDLICHGVPSPKIFKKYLEEIKNENKCKISKIQQRYKNDAWSDYYGKIELENGKIILKKGREDIFKGVFLSNIALMESCYQCKFSELQRHSDITLGDYWGIATRYPHLDDNMGTSEVLVNSDKGKKWIEEINDNVTIEETDMEFGVKMNPYLISFAKEHKNREKFFEDIDDYSLKELYERLK